MKYQIIDDKSDDEDTCDQTYHGDDIHGDDPVDGYGPDTSPMTHSSDSHVRWAKLAAECTRANNIKYAKTETVKTKEKGKVTARSGPFSGVPCCVRGVYVSGLSLSSFS